jgi:hypothetical protein
MARFNEILTGRYNRFMQKLLSMKGPASLSQLASELQAVFPVFNGAENRYLEAWDLFGISMSPTGGAAQSAATRLRNPTGSNVMVVVHGLIVIAVGTTQNISIVQTQLAADLTTVSATTTSRLDARGRSAPTSIISSTVNYGAIPGVQPWFLQLLPASPFQLVQDSVQEVPVLPGNTLDVIDNSLNAQIIVSYAWRERLLEESERT